jgi:hypothetical protein
VDNFHGFSPDLLAHAASSIYDKGVIDKERVKDSEHEGLNCRLNNYRVFKIKMPDF